MYQVSTSNTVLPIMYIEHGSLLEQMSIRSTILIKLVLYESFYTSV